MSAPARGPGVAQWLRSALFTTLLFVAVFVYGLGLVLAAPLGYRRVYRLVVWWAGAMLWLVERSCGLRYTVEGSEHLPREPAVALVKHSSTWETIAQFKLFPMQTWVLKRELLWAPVLGWVILMLKPIGIDRRGGRSAVQQVVAQGRARLAEGLWVVIFPEGTRVPAGQAGRYGISGALLAIEAGVPVVPVAHDAGDYWPRRSLLKKPGTIRVVIGPAIASAGRDARDVTDEARRWIEAQVAELRRSAGTSTSGNTPKS